MAAAHNIPPFIRHGLLLQVQGHVAQTDIDPGAAPEWLRIADDQLLPSPNAGITLRSARLPCLHLALPKTSISNGYLCWHVITHAMHFQVRSLDV